ncbi:MAG: DUF5606 domain-containing protein [Bacteroidales bacterium]|jgi:hypothetical protein|nr:DUF5606 domain-containing protein [Bacteroidales bacterium]
MDLKEIMAIGGKPGLYKMVAQAKNGIIIESILDQKRTQAFAHDKISSLEEISVFTDTEDKPLKEVLRSFYEKLEGKQTPDFKNDSNKLKAFFGEMLPDYDKERVYTSHMQKIISWYNLLIQHNLLDFSENDESSGEAPQEETKSE